MVERYKLYEYDYKSSKIALKRTACPRCGKIMASHQNRMSCGYCGYSVFPRAS